MTVNLWGTALDPKTGLPVYPVKTASTATKLRKRAEEARKAREALQDRLDALTSEFESAFAESDKLAATRARIAAAAKTTRI